MAVHQAHAQLEASLWGLRNPSIAAEHMATAQIAVSRDATTSEYASAIEETPQDRSVSLASYNPAHHFSEDLRSSTPQQDARSKAIAPNSTEGECSEVPPISSILYSPQPHLLHLQASYTAKRGARHKSQSNTKTQPSTTVEVSEVSEVSGERKTDLPIKSRHQDSPVFPPESSTSPRRTSVVPSAGNVLTASTAQLQSWESAASSSSNTLVGVPSTIRESFHGHIRTVSGSSTAQKSRRSSSVSREADGLVKSEDAQRHSDPLDEAGEVSASSPVSVRRSPPPPVRYTPWVPRDRPRSGSTIRFQQGVSDSRQSHLRRFSTPQLSPLMPLVFQPDLPLDVIEYTGRRARTLHTLYPVLYFAHIPLTLFLDFNILYALVQIALHPTAEGQAVIGGSIQGSPRVGPWWIAIGFYALSSFIWLFVIVLIHDLYYRHFKVWKNRKLRSSDAIVRPKLNLETRLR